MLTPKLNFAPSRTAVRLPVVCHIMAVAPSRNFCRNVPQSMVPSGITLCFTARSRQNCMASITAGLSK